MKTEFDLNNLTDADVDNALYTNAIHSMVAPNYRQLGMNLENDIFRTSGEKVSTKYGNQDNHCKRQCTDDGGGL